MVYSPLQAAAKYFKYYIHAANSKGHGTHSPFVFEFITKVLNDFNTYDAYQKVEPLRKQLKKDNRELTIQDFGAGSAATDSDKRTIASIARNAAKSKKFAQLLFRIVKYYQFTNILELGTSLGLTTAYLSLANTDGKIITIEGADEVADIAEQNFRQLNLNNIVLVRGNFDKTLATSLQKMPLIDFAFIDGNHRKEPTERYFNLLLPHLHNGSILVFDDIHWSAEMEAAWKNIVAHESVTCDIDLFYIGIVSFKKEFKEKRTFSVRF
ncbi:MAG: class I SAM-dependent methyltransferase [Sphingobacteriales bacterium]|jgi:predicted O-methyltransferase YrrM|nr:class I SAM-dependent methyltransferase [Sphingobacteriales bacterium]